MTSLITYSAILIVLFTILLFVFRKRIKQTWIEKNDIWVIIPSFILFPKHPRVEFVFTWLKWAFVIGKKDPLNLNGSLIIHNLYSKSGKLMGQIELEDIPPVIHFEGRAYLRELGSYIAILWLGSLDFVVKEPNKQKGQDTHDKKN